MKSVLIFYLILISALASGQDIPISKINSKLIDLHEVKTGNENFDGFDRFKTVLKDVTVVTLGEESHYDGTTLDTKVKLIKYLHDELGFDLLVFESGFYDSKAAWNKISNGADIDLVLAEILVDAWGIAEQFQPLADYISDQVKTDDPLMILGFDSQFFNKTKSSNYLNDLKTFLNTADPSILNTNEWRHLESSIGTMLDFDYGTLRKRDIVSDTVYINTLISWLTNLNTLSEVDFWIQTLENLKCHFSDIAFKINDRDRQMAENLIWIHQKYPDKKIICWGATSHFLYNSETIRATSPVVQLLAANTYKKSPMMGTYLKKKYGEKLYTIGFTAYSGAVGFGTSSKLKPPREKSLEYILAKASCDNFFLPLQELDLSGYISRPLGYHYIKTGLAKVMDGLIFNRTMTPVRLNRELYDMIFPDNAIPESLKK